MMQQLAATEVRKGIKDVRKQISRLLMEVDAGKRLASLHEVEMLYSLVFDLRKLIQDGGKWEPNESYEELLTIFKRLVISHSLFCDNGLHTGKFKIRLDNLYVSAEEFVMLERFLNEP